MEKNFVSGNKLCIRHNGVLWNGIFKTWKDNIVVNNQKLVTIN